jgi:starvation-inducible DNA-binding protein
MAGKMHTTRNDIPAEQRKKLVTLLNQQLADTLDLYSQTKFAHWNVKGSDFIQLHLFYDTLAEHVIGFVDLIAERATTLGGTALGTTRMAAKTSALDEFPSTALNGMDSVTALAERFASYAQSTRQAIEDSDKLEDDDTSDLFTEVSRQIDTDLWFLEAHLQKA